MKSLTLEETIRKAVRERVTAGESILGIAKASGVPQPVLSRFVRGGRSLHLSTAQHLIDYLGLKLEREE